jgi:hypothetical protein
MTPRSLPEARARARRRPPQLSHRRSATICSFLAGVAQPPSAGPCTAAVRNRAQELAEATRSSSTQASTAPSPSRLCHRPQLPAPPPSATTPSSSPSDYMGARVSRGR